MRKLYVSEEYELWNSYHFHFGAVEDWVSELMVPDHEDYLR